MALPSQTRLPTRRRIYMDRRPRRTRRVIVVTAVAALLVIGTVRVVLTNRQTQPGGSLPLAATGPEIVPAHMPPLDTAPPATAAPAAVPPTVEDVPSTVPAASITPEVPTPTPLPERPSKAGTPSRTPARVSEGLALAQRNLPVQARELLTAALGFGRLVPADADFVRETVRSLNRRLVFSPQIVPGDPFSYPYVVRPGEQLAGIVRDQSLDVDWRFILRINRMLSARHLRVGQKLKLVTGPFHVIVDKSDYRMDFYLGEGEKSVYVTSMAVGLGTYDSTPLGRFRVRPGSKAMNPSWANPRTGEFFDRDDPANPIGEHWIGLEGIDDGTRGMIGYGIHGTIDPDSIGRQASMGCIRLRPEDVVLAFEMLTYASTVEIRP